MTFNLTVDTRGDTRDYNLPLYGMRGEFSLSGGVRVPYFSTLIDLNRATAELKTHEEVSPSLDTVYSLRELFQRQLDKQRVEKDIVKGYLRSPTKLKFFNSITVVLLPKDENGKICRHFENYSNNDPKIPADGCSDFDQNFIPNDQSIFKIVFGGVQLVTTSAEGISRLRWDRGRVDAVAVDGQHRLKALKMWMDGKNRELTASEKPTRISVLFLLLDKAAGFDDGGGRSDNGIKNISREIFTDLNKNAKEVDLATTIVLDDLSVEACCVRSIITDSTCVDDDHLLPLSLLRWQDQNNRFDSSYYLNSMVNLYLLIKDLLEIKPPDPLEKTSVVAFIDHITALLGQGSPRALRYEGVDLLEHYQATYLDDDKDAAKTPFSGLPPHYLPAALEGFKIRFSPWLVAVLRRFKPYRLVLEYANANNLIEGEFSQYLAQPQLHRQELEKDLEAQYGKNWKLDIIDRHVQAIQDIKGVGNTDLGEQWAFKTLFQKAMIKLGAELFVRAADDEREKFGTVQDFLDFLDTLYDHDILRVLATIEGDNFKLWSFIAVNPIGQKIKVSRTSEKRIFSVLVLWYFGVRYASYHNLEISLEPGVHDGFVGADDLLKTLSLKHTQPQWPHVHDSYDELMRLFTGGACSQQLKNSNSEPSEAERRKIARERINLVFRTGIKVFASGNTPAARHV